MRGWGFFPVTTTTPPTQSQLLDDKAHPGKDPLSSTSSPKQQRSARAWGGQVRSPHCRHAMNQTQDRSYPFSGPQFLHLSMKELTISIIFKHVEIPRSDPMYKSNEAPLPRSLCMWTPLWLLTAPLGGKTVMQITPKASVGSTNPGTPAGAFLFRGRGGKGAGRVTGGNVIWIAGMYSETRRSRPNICFSLVPSWSSH